MYPVMLNLENKRIVVVGGGRIATKKILNLVEQKAKIIVVSPTLTEELQSFAQQKKIEWYPRYFVIEDVKGAFLVFAATDNREVNEQVKISCAKDQLVNVIDEPSDSTFYNMAVFERGLLKIAISTEGASPFLAKQIKAELKGFFDDGYEEYLNFLLEARIKIKELVLDEETKRALLLELVNEKYRNNVEDREQFFKGFR
ncbi:NAD(P)-binding protein [Ureibacillus xyleni]|nr:NAD(P)-binding protein [Ureibacillus xyleni]